MVKSGGSLGEEKGMDGNRGRKVADIQKVHTASQDAIAGNDVFLGECSRHKREAFKYKSSDGKLKLTQDPLVLSACSKTCHVCPSRKLSDMNPSLPEERRRRRRNHLSSLTLRAEQHMHHKLFLPPSEVSSFISSKRKKN